MAGDGTKIYTRREAAAYLGLDRQGLAQPLEALRWLYRTGRLRYARIGRRVVFRQAWLDELVENGTVLRPDPPRRRSARQRATKPGPGLGGNP